MRIFVIVCSDVEANPSAAVFHVVFECRSLFGSLREVVEPQDQTIRLEIVFVELRPVRGGIQYKVTFCRQLLIEGERVFGGLDVIRLNIG